MYSYTLLMTQYDLANWKYLKKRVMKKSDDSGQ